VSSCDPRHGTPQWRRLLAEWMRHHGREGNQVHGIRSISGGTQNCLTRFVFGDCEYVLRMPPRSVTSAADSRSMIAREARILGALATTDVPHAPLVGVETTSNELGGAFLVTEFVTGFNAISQLPEPIRDDMTAQRSITAAAADAAVRLARVDPVAIGLSDLGRAADWAPRQVTRWTRVWHGYRDMDGYSADSLATARAVHDRLTRSLPLQVRFGLVHGDLHVGNMLVAGDGRRIAALVDWELTTLGDVRLDLAHLVVTWPGTLTSWPPAPGWICTDSRGLIENYAEDIPEALADFAWFRLLAAYRMAILLEGSFTRSFVNTGDSARGEWLHTIAVELLDHALELGT
jgi:aminoglycoside phosphotransferase (APT) family kinase protein